MGTGMFSKQKYRREKHPIRECNRKGVNDKKGCKKILQQHHNDLKDDPERLSTKFIADVAGCKCRLVIKKQEENHA